MEQQDGEMIKKCFELPLGTDLTTSSTNKSSPYFMAISMPVATLSIDCEFRFVGVEASSIIMLLEGDNMISRLGLF